MNWFYWDFALHVTEIDKLAHFTYPFFGVIGLAAIFCKRKVKFRALRTSIILVILASLIVEAVQCWVVKTDLISGGDLIADGAGITAAGYAFRWIEETFRPKPTK